jgi:hypothetical protein
MAVLPEPTVGAENGTGPAEALAATRRINNEIRKVMRAPELKRGTRKYANAGGAVK